MLRIEVDLSGRIEQAGPIVLAFSDGISHAVIERRERKSIYLIQGFEQDNYSPCFKRKSNRGILEDHPLHGIISTRTRPHLHPRTCLAIR